MEGGQSDVGGLVKVSRVFDDPCCCVESMSVEGLEK